MARRKNGLVPGYRKHRPSGQAVVTLSGQDFYLGPHGTKVSKAEYDRVVAEWLARGRHPLIDAKQQGVVTLVELAARYKIHAKSYYRKNGEVTNEYTAIVNAVKVACGSYGREPASDFGPLKLQAVQQAMIRLGWCRKQINKQSGRIVRMFAWGTSQEIVPAGVAAALREVRGLHKGRTEARESDPVMPVDEPVVQSTLHHLPAIVTDMVKLQRLTGMRPEEVCLIRPCDVDTSGNVWCYRPESHKTAHHGRERVICVGPKGQNVLRPYLLRAKDSYCFSPTESERKRRADAAEKRATPIGYGNRPGTNKSRNPKRPAGDRYTTASYRRAIHRACDAAKVDRWSPNRLRHSAATEIRKRFGLEAAQVTLGHSGADVTQIYAERDLQKAVEVMAEVG